MILLYVQPCNSCTRVQDLKAVMFEAKMLSKKVRRLQTEKQEMESQVQAVSRDYEFLFRKASALEADRVQLKKLAHEKRHMLEVKEQECIKLTTALGNLQRNLDTEVCYRDLFFFKCNCLIQNQFVIRYCVCLCTPTMSSF